MSRWARIIQHSIQHHGTIIIMVHLLGCTVSTSTEMDPLEAFYSEVNDRHGLSTAWAPLAFILLGTVSLSLWCSLASHATACTTCRCFNACWRRCCGSS
ncbi:hypothetical protein PVAP13_9NG788900 [Panicum virgatum]|uniref:Uncharacterized protein n=1 Tax=Panicum virgatum TaxID=38727 RepID=A0A8T0N3T3_PANVG|nr:hypothetical protein PVAP13_9NG788900 [Panicum virgatum]